MIYDVYMQVKRNGLTHAHVPALPGCNWLGHSPDEAMRLATEKINNHLIWLHSHNQVIPTCEEDVIPHLAQQHPANQREGLVGFFESDQEPVTDNWLHTCLELMNYSRQDLLVLTQPLPDQTLDWERSPGEWSIRIVLRHVASAEQWYLTRIFGPGYLPRFKPAKTVWDRLSMVRITAINQLASLTEEQKSATFKRNGELWTSRKALRRFLEHELEHTHHIQEILADWSIDH